MSRSCRVLSIALAASVALPPLPVIGQMLEEVIVTARKKEESIMEVPVVATTVGYERLEKFSLSNLEDISEQVPGLLIGGSVLSIGAQVSLRGLGTSTLNSAIDQSVSLNLDGLQLTQGVAYTAGFFDIEQVEVLKGPQALFFGKASPGGVIAVKTAGPGEKFEARLRYGFEAEAEEHRTDFIVSGPLTETFGLRLASTYTEQDGYFTNAARALPETGARAPRYRGFPTQTEWLVRGTAQWDPTPRLRSQLKINVMSAETDGDAGQQQMASCPDGVRAPAGIPFIGGGEDCRIDDEIRIVDLSPEAFPVIRNNGTPFSDVESTFGALELNYDLGRALTLTSVTGFYAMDQKSMINATQSTFAAPALAADNDFEREDLTQELRLASSFTSPVNFVVGAFYQDAKMSKRTNLPGNTEYEVGPEQIINSPIDIPTTVEEPTRVVPLPAILMRGFQDIDIKTLSAFGQLLWNVTPDLELAVGARWTDEKRKLSIVNMLSGEPEPVPTANPDLAASDISPEITVTYTPTEDLTVFGAVKRAFKSGSFNIVVIPSPGEDVSFGEEEITGGEVGVKTRLFDRRLFLDVAAYYYQYDDLQVGANETDESGTIVIRTLNAASADVHGVDLNAAYQFSAVPGLSLYGAANYNRSEYDEFENAPCWGGQLISEGCDRIRNPDTGNFTAQNLSGEDLMRAPAWQANIGLDYETPVWGGLTLALGWNTTYSDSYLANILARDDMVRDEYAKHNVNVSLKGVNDAWEVSLIGKNLTDELTSGLCVNANFENGVIYGGFETGSDQRGPAGVDELSCNMEPGRSLWVRFTVQLSEFM